MTKYFFLVQHLKHSDYISSPTPAKAATYNRVGRWSSGVYV